MESANDLFLYQKERKSDGLLLQISYNRVWKYCCFWGWLCYDQTNSYTEFNILEFADNVVYKQRNFVFGYPIRLMDQLDRRHQEKGVSVIIASTKWSEMGIELKKGKFRLKRYSRESI